MDYLKAKIKIDKESNQDEFLILLNLLKLSNLERKEGFYQRMKSNLQGCIGKLDFEKKCLLISFAIISVIENKRIEYWLIIIIE